MYPRVEYDADGNRLGLLVEESRTNLILNSSDFSASSWTKIGTSISAATSITAPDGTTNSFKLIESSGTGIHRVQGAPAAGGTTSTMSCFMKKAERSWGNINFSNLGQGNVWFDLENGVLGTVGTAVTAKIEDYGNGWYRCSVTGTPSSEATTDIKVANADEALSYAGDGTSGIYVFGAQTEAGSFPTSYIKTTGSTATRSADLASIPVADFGYNQSAFTVFIEASHLYDTFPTFNRFWELRGGGDSLGLYGNGGGSSYMSMTVGGVSQITFSDGAAAAADANTFMKYGIGLKTNDFDIARDGSLDAGDTSVTMPDAIDTFNIGKANANAAILNGHIKSIKYYPRRLTNAQLQDITS